MDELEQRVEVLEVALGQIKVVIGDAANRLRSTSNLEDTLNDIVSSLETALDLQSIRERLDARQSSSEVE